jgi:hypothetical protein
MRKHGQQQLLLGMLQTINRAHTVNGNQVVTGGIVASSAGGRNCPCCVVAFTATTYMVVGNNAQPRKWQRMYILVAPYLPLTGHTIIMHGAWYLASTPWPTVWHTGRRMVANTVRAMRTAYALQGILATFN